MIKYFFEKHFSKIEKSDESHELQTYCIPIVNEKTKEGVSDNLTNDLKTSKNKSLQDMKDGYTNIPVKRIRPNPHQPRKQFNESSIGELAQTIKLKGLIQPIVVRTVNSPEADFELIVGERRLRAIISLNMETIPAVIRDDISTSDSGAFALIENLHREDLSVLDKASGFCELKEELGNAKSTAEILGINEKTVDRYLKIAKTVSEIPEIGELIKDKNMDFSKAFNVCILGGNLTKLKKEEPEKFSEMIRRLREGEKASSNIVVKMKRKKGNRNSKEVQKNEKLGRKNFWFSDTKVGLCLEIDRGDSKAIDFAIEEIEKFIQELGLRLKFIDLCHDALDDK